MNGSQVNDNNNGYIKSNNGCLLKTANGKTRWNTRGTGTSHMFVSHLWT